MRVKYFKADIIYSTTGWIEVNEAETDVNKGWIEKYICRAKINQRILQQFPIALRV